jgi:transposase-like protein
VKLVISEAHTGLKKAISTVFQGAGWKRCRIHFMHNVLAVLPRASQEMVASIIRTIFAQLDAEHNQKQFAEVTTMLTRSHPEVAAMLTDTEADLLGFAAFPRRHWREVWSTSAIERVKKESTVAPTSSTCSPNPADSMRLSRSVLIKQHNEWEAAERRYFSEASMLELATMNKPIEILNEAVMLPELAAA